MATPTTAPGVYIREVPTLPPLATAVATAIPAFIGRTVNGRASTVEIATFDNLLEYEERFGKPATAFTLGTDGALTALTSNVPAAPLWYALNMYFANGGGRCYVVSVGDTATAATGAQLAGGLTALEGVDDPTLIVVPEAATLGMTEFKVVADAALAHCQKTQDRFAILDVPFTGNARTDMDAFRTSGVSTDYLMYGAAYYPFLKTTLPHQYDEAALMVGTASLASLKDSNTPLYNKIKRTLAEQRVELPPSAALAGVYARVDRERGVWKAPANASLAQVIAPSVHISDALQGDLNADATAGKSINAIRAFSGKGVLVWGARTLAGNDAEWRYINVRRLFITIEETAKKSTAFAVFEPNDSSTWLKVKGMLEAYLYSLWEQGALQGATHEQAFYVNVGLGKTMTPQHILDGVMIVELGIAAVRPAEFIELRFSHKLAEA